MGREEPPRLSRRVATTVLCLVMGLIPLMGFWLFYSTAAADLARAMNSARALGGPVTLQEMMNARRQWPDDRNGANVILSVQPRLDELKRELDKKDSPLRHKLPVLGDMDNPDPGRRWSDQTIADVEQFLADLKPQLDVLDTLADYEGGRFPLAIPENAIMIDLPHLKDLRCVAKLRRLHCVLRGMQGDTTEVVRDLANILRVARLVADEPALISSLVKIAIDALAVATAEQVLAITQFEPEQLLAIQSLFSGSDPHPQMLHAIRSERAMWIGLIDHTRRVGSNAGPGKIPPFVSGSRTGALGVIMREEARGIELYNRVLRRSDPLGMIEEYRTIGSELAAGKHLKLLASTFGQIPRGMEHHVTSAAEMRCAETAMAVERFRLAEERCPQRLEELVPAYIARIPEDPFQPGRPLQMLCRDGRFIVYSIGRDREDDGGDLPLRTLGDEADVGFILLEPHLRNLPALPTSQPASQPDSRPT